MDHTDAFLEPIREAIDDDAPRLVFADWLQERGDPRGEFIRVQCDLARLAEDDPRRPDLEIRERELLDAHEAEWLQPFQQWVPSYQRPTWKRGFIEDVHLSDMGEFLTHAPDICRLMPIRHVSIYLGDNYQPAHLTSFVAVPELQRVTELSLCNGPVGNAGVQALVASPHLGRLTELSLSYCQVGSAGAAALAGCARLEHLRRLDLSSDYLENSEDMANSFGAEGIRVLGRSPHLRNVIDLNLSGLRLPFIALRTLAGSPLMKRLTKLALGSTGEYGGGLSGLRVLVRSPQARQLRALDLNRCWLEAADFVALASSPNLVALQKLNLMEAYLGQGALEALTTSPLLPALTELSLDHCQDQWSPPEGQMGRAGLDLLLGSPLLDRLTNLGLSAQGFGPADAEALAASPRIRQLRQLTLNNNPLGDAGVRALADSPHLGNLMELGVAGAGIGTEGVRSLVSARGMLSRLKRLDLGGNSIGQTGAQLLANSPQVADLRSLHLWDSDIGDDGVKALVASPYLQALRRLDLTGSGKTIGAEAFQQLRERWGRWANAFC